MFLSVLIQVLPVLTLANQKVFQDCVENYQKGCGDMVQQRKVWVPNTVMNCQTVVPDMCNNGSKLVAEMKTCHEEFAKMDKDKQKKIMEDGKANMTQEQKEFMKCVLEGIKKLKAETKKTR